MATYYYAAAALPMLFLSEKPAIDSADFILFCKEQCTDKDFKILESSRLEIETGNISDNKILTSWRNWEISLRNELVKLRAAEFKKDPQEYLIEGKDIIGLAAAAKNAFSSENPLETEEKIYSIRWDYLEELGTNVFFTLDSLIIYYLKLQLLEKLNQFEAEKGAENFEKVYTQIRESGDHDENNEIESNSGVNP